MKKFRRARSVRSFFSLVLMALLFFSLTLPIEFCKAVGTPSFWTSKVYPMGLIEEGSADAGFKGNLNEYAFFSTSLWTQHAVDLQRGSLVTTANLVSIPGTILPMTLSLTYSSLNASLDIGFGKGWMSNLNTCVSEDSQSHDLTLVTSSGSHLTFTWDGNNSKYVNPSGFTGLAVENQDGTYTIQTLGGDILTFSSNGKLYSLSSRTGGLLLVGYDGSGRPETLTDDKSSREITLTWSVAGKVTGITDSMNNTWTLTYDSDNLSQIKQPTDESPDPDIHTTFGYDSSHKMTSQVDFEGFTYSLTYHTSGYQTGKVATFVEPTENDATTEFLYEEITGDYDLKTTLTDGEDRETYFYFSDTSGSLEKISAGSGTTERKTEYDYNSLGLVEETRDSYGSETQFSYDTVGHIASITYPAVTAGTLVQEFTYSPTNSVLGKLTMMREKVTSSVWAETELDYTDQDAPYSPSEITNPANQVTTIAYNSDQQPTSVTTTTTGGNKITVIAYHPTTGNTTSITDSEGNETVLAYNNNGLVVETTEYEGDADTGTPVNAWEMTINALSVTLGADNTQSDQSTSIEMDDNGFTEMRASLTGCITSLTVSLQGNMAARGVDLVGGGLGPVYTLPVVPFDPTPITTTNTRGQTSSFTYDDSGALLTSISHLGLTTTLTRDAFGGVATQTDPYGRLTEYTYNRNAQTTEVEVEGVGSYTYTRNARGDVTNVSDPIKGSLSYTYNVRGDVISSPDGSITRDILGRTTGISYTGGGSDSMSYTPEGWLSSLSNASFAYDTLGNSTSWSDGTNSSTFSYTGANGSTKLGLPSSISGSGDTGSYSFTYLANHWMRTLTDSGKNKTFTFDYNTDSTLAQLQYPNQTVLSQTWSNKMLDEVKVTKGEDTYLESDATFNEDDQLTAFETEVYAGQNTTFSESNTLEYDTSHRLSELSYGSSSKTLTYSYDSSVGLLSSILDSELEDTYDFSYDSKGRLSTVGYPDSQNSATYTYNDTTGQGRLEEVNYPNDRSMTLTWDGRDRITQIDLDDDGTVTTYALSFTDLNQIKRILKSEGGLALYSWNFSYGPLGLEKGVVKDPYNQTLLTQDYTVDKNGTILSMTYTPAGYGGTFVGELYMAYDPCGNLALMTNATGDPQVSYAYDRGTTGITDVYNPGGIENLFTIAGKQGQITLPGFGDDWITLPIQRPGQMKALGRDVAVHIMADGTVPHIWGPDCGEVGTCGSTLRQRYDLCMARCFTYGVGGIGDLTEPKSTDGYARANYGNWVAARNSFGKVALEILEHGKPYLDAIDGFDEALEALKKGKILKSLRKIASFASDLATIINNPKVHQDVKIAFKQYKENILGVTSVGGKSLGLTFESSTKDFIGAFVKCLAQEAGCAVTCALAAMMGQDSE